MLGLGSRRGGNGLAPGKWSGGQQGAAEGIKVYLNRRRYSFVGEGGKDDWSGTSGTDNLPLLKSLLAQGREIELDGGDFWFDNSAVAAAAAFADSARLYGRSTSRVLFSTNSTPMLVVRNKKHVAIEGVEAVGLGAFPASFAVTRAAFEAAFGSTFAAGDRDYNYWLYASGCTGLRLSDLQLKVSQPSTVGQPQRGWLNIAANADGSTGLWLRVRRVYFDGLAMGLLLAGQDESVIEDLVADHRCQYTPVGEAACHPVYVSTAVLSAGMRISRLRDRGNFVSVGDASLKDLFTINFRGVTDGTLDDVKAVHDYPCASLELLTDCVVRNIKHKINSSYAGNVGPCHMPDINTRVTIDNIRLIGDYGIYSRFQWNPGSNKSHLGLIATGLYVESTGAAQTASTLTTQSQNSYYDLTVNYDAAAWTAAGSERSAFDFQPISSNNVARVRSVGAGLHTRVSNVSSSGTFNSIEVVSPTGLVDYAQPIFGQEAAATGIIRSAGTELTTRRSGLGTGTSPTVTTSDILLHYDGVWEIEVTASDSAKTNVRKSRFECTVVGGVVADINQVSDRLIVGTVITAIALTSPANNKVRIGGTASSSISWLAAARRKFVGPLV